MAQMICKRRDKEYVFIFDDEFQDIVDELGKWYASQPMEGKGGKRVYAEKRLTESQLKILNNYYREKGIQETQTTTLMLHRLVMGVTNPKVLVDHVDTSNTLDNRKSNLRLVTHIENAQNRKTRRDSSTGYKGVYRVVQKRKSKDNYHIYLAYIGIDGKHIRLGYYKTAEEAARARDKASKEYFGEYAVLNFPEE